MKGLALVQNNIPVAMLAISVIDGSNFIVCNVKPEASKKMLIVGWEIFKDQFMTTGTSYYAIQDDEIATSKGFIAHFGFRHLKENIYIFRR